MACDGPNGSQWRIDGCVGTAAQTSCDEMAGQTCYYAALEFSPLEYLGGKFVAGDSGPFEITCPGALEKLIGLNPGTIIHTLNGRKVTPKAIMRWTPQSPATSAAFTCSTTGKHDLRLG